ncbi:MAG: hypothetical protein BWY37_01900 [Firmicutes bacterium ADurb.Bin262]|nr:MAG: hypothetical protein BWY37_01900 [Firmicutes bacterium ADurb.Bin262]
MAFCSSVITRELTVVLSWISATCMTVNFPCWSNCSAPEKAAEAVSDETGNSVRAIARARNALKRRRERFMAYSC